MRCDFKMYLLDFILRLSQMEVLCSLSLFTNNILPHVQVIRDDQIVRTFHSVVGLHKVMEGKGIIYI